MTVREAFLVGMCAITASCGDKTADKPAPSGSGEPSVKVAAPAQPALVDAPAPALPSKPSAADTFTAQTRDTGWAPEAEGEIARRFKRVRGAKLEEAECRQSQCRLVIHGSEGDVGQTIADLEGPRGLHGYATNIVLTAPEKQADGSIRLRAYAVFDR